MISVCLNTKNRPQPLANCLSSLRQSRFQNFEIIVVDQSDNQDKNLGKQRGIRYFPIKSKGVGWAKNVAITKTKGDIIAFTDDDCIVDRSWLKNIYQSFRRHKDIAGIFGQTKPYQPQKNRGLICPCTFENKKVEIITKPAKHWQEIGLGNNMAFRREIFEKVGGFKEWLGAGSIGSNAEDAEFALRCLIKGCKLMYNPQMVVYHNRWLTREEFRRQFLSYSCGETACYSFFAFQGLNLGKKVVINNFKDSYWEFRKAVKSLLLFKKGSIKLLFENFEKLFFRLRGLLIGWYYSRKDYCKFEF